DIAPPGDARAVGIRRSTRYCPEVESLRGLAILLVFALHFDGLVQPPPGRAGTVVSPALAFVAAGHTGVNLFFILSGFLLSLPFLGEAAGSKSVGRREYLARRALRILPLYWTGVVVGTLLTMQQASDLGHGVPYLFFL